MDHGDVPRRNLLSSMMLTGAGISSILADAAVAEAADAPAGEVLVDRAFVRIDEGLVHYRAAGSPKNRKAIPLYMVHGGPGSSRGLENLLKYLGRDRYVIAPDTLGYGDSAAPALAKPEIDYYADSVRRILDGLKIDKVDFYGSHTGAHIGTELALRAPDRVRRLIFDGVTHFPPEERANFLANYAPAVTPDVYGRQLTWAWHFVRDMALFFPYFTTDAAHRLPRGVPAPQALHNSVLDVLKALSTYHLSYNAVYRHDLASRLPLLTNPVLCITSEADPNIRYLDAAAALIKNVKKVAIAPAERVERAVAEMNEFLKG